MSAPQGGASLSPSFAPAAPGDTVDGVPAAYVAHPASAAELVDVMREAAELGQAVVARGRGTKLDWGGPPSRVDLVVDLSGMDRVLEHAAGDLIVRAEPGVRLSDLQALLAGSGQRLALD
jgi:glycolate oxidase FAD binding subunit